MKQRKKHGLRYSSAAPRPKGRLSRRVYLCIGALYLLVTVGASIYAQTGYVDRLPGVTITAIEEGRVSMDWVHYDDTEDKYTINLVEQQDGPWGKRYLVRVMELINYMAIDENTLLVFGATTIESPVIVSFAAERLYEGQEVRLRGRV